MTLRREYCRITCNLIVWQPHQDLLYDLIYEARLVLRAIDHIRAGGKWEDEL